jgi:hypothetical protein
MCGPSDNSAKIAERNEEARRARITRGTGLVNAQFEGFNEGFYDARQDAYKKFYLPQLREDVKGARANTIYDLGRSGLIDSSVGAKRFADLQSLQDTGLQRINEGARRYGQELRGNVENQRSQLLRGIEASGEYGASAGNANLAAQQATLTPTYNPISDLFAQYSQGASNAALVQGYGGQANPFYSALFNLFPQKAAESKPTVRTIG